MNTAAALPFASQDAPGKLVSIVLAVTVHLLLLSFLFYGIRWQNPQQEAIEVELVQAAPAVTEAVAPPVEQPPPQAVAEPEPAPPPKPEIALKEKEKPKPKEPPRPEPKALPKPLPSPAPFQKQLEQELKQAAERKNAAAVEQELSQLRSAQVTAARNKAIADYIGRIRGKIKGNIVLPPDLRGNPEAVFDVVQLPSGEILSARLKKSSGHAGYDSAVERAILKSSPLPKPENGDLFHRDLELKFRPLEE